MRNRGRGGLPLGWGGAKHPSHMKEQETDGIFVSMQDEGGNVVSVAQKLDDADPADVFSDIVDACKRELNKRNEQDETESFECTILVRLSNTAPPDDNNSDDSDDGDKNGQIGPTLQGERSSKKLRTSPSELAMDPHAKEYPTATPPIATAAAAPPIAAAAAAANDNATTDNATAEE